MQYQLRNYQVEGVNFWLRNPRCCFWFDMGLGKTLTALHTLASCRSRLPALIVAPLRVARFVWPAEIEKFGFDFSHSLVWGPDKSGQLLAPTDIKIVNPEGLKLIESTCRERGRVPFRTVIVDESTLFKNPASKRWKSLRAIIEPVENRLLLTGTPMPNSHADIWGQMALLGPNCLGEYRDFLEKNFSIDPFGRPRIRKGRGQIIEGQIRPIVLRKKIDDEIDMPDLIEVDERVEMTPDARLFYDAVESGIEQVAMDNYSPLRTLASGFHYDNHWSGVRSTEWHGDWKFDRVAGIAEESGDNLLVVYNFRGERERLVERFGCPFIDGGSKAAAEEKAILDWNRGKTKMLAVHARSVGHGVNLQFGGRRVVWVSLPDSGEVYEQMNARLYRSGQINHVIVHRILVDDTIDMAIAGLLKRKCLSQANLLRAMQR